MNIPAGKFYLGKLFDLAKSQLLDQPVLYDPADLTTHGVIVGMTGSGKTGLGIALLEEAALAGIPALVIDPKGDVTNLLLHFPDLAPSDFAPWVDVEQAGREGKNAAQAAEDAAASWKKGLADWGITSDRIRALQRAAQFAVFTPGSEAGLPVSVLASLQAPDVPWNANQEILRERIASTVTAILGLVGVTAVDPLQSREHILLSNILESAWSAGQSLTLETLILQTQTPPFPKLGVFDVESFFPARDRQALAMRLNSVLASPSFQPWVTGQPLVMDSLLRAPDGRPRHSVFSIAHLSDTERMFFVTLLLSTAEAWMRTRSGASGLRALIYFDEIFGYLPPVANPPAKTVIIRMLKQARAFGLGLVLATQNPVDLDYKALSNAGTWFIGKLQTDQDKQRLLDGLEAPGIPRAQLDKTISLLGKRIFLLHNTHAKGPAIFETRWTMDYLAGPLTRAQIPAVNKLAGAALTGGSAGPGPKPVFAPVPVSAVVPTGSTRPAIPAGIAEYFLPQNLSLQQAAQAAGRGAPAQAACVYRPVLLAQAKARFLERKYGIDQMETKTALVLQPDKRGVIRWQDFTVGVVDEAALPKGPAGAAEFATLEAPLSDGKMLRDLEKDFLDWVYRESTLKVSAASAQGAGGQQASIDKKLDALHQKLERAQLDLQQHESEVKQRALEEIGTGAENILSLFGGRRRQLTTSLTKRRLTSEAQGQVDQAKQQIEQLQKEIAGLEQQKSAGTQQSFAASEITLTPAKKDVYTELFGVAWAPYYRLADGTEWIGCSFR